MNRIQLSGRILLGGFPVEISEFAHRTRALARTTLGLHVQSLLKLEALAVVGKNHWAAVVADSNERSV